MAEYSITAANHQNINNHVASSFLVWLFDATEKKWKQQGSKSAKEVVGLIESGNTVLTGQIGADGSLYRGEPVEVELRIAKNSTKYDISKMPKF